MPTIEGVVRRVTYYNQESSYLVGRLDVPGFKEPVTFVGHFTPLGEGEHLRLKGEWHTHARYGRQLKVHHWERLAPATLDGLKKYLGSGMIKGVGPVTAERLVRHFGSSVLEVIEQTPEKLTEVEGIGEKKAAQIVASYRDQQEIKEVMLFLQDYGVSPAFAVRLFRHYGSEAVEKVKEDPFRLAEEVHGIGFKTADKIAAKMGIPPDSPKRIRACIRYVLGKGADEGHVCLPRELLEERVAELVKTETELDIEPILYSLCEERLIFLEEVEGKEYVYLAPFYYAETGAVKHLRALLNAKVEGDTLFAAKAEQIFASEKLNLTNEQQEVVRQAVKCGLMVATGGPGTGKTTTIRVLVELFNSEGLEVALAAPTGRAAKRMSEATGFPAKTIHRLLEYTFQEGKGFYFQRDTDNPLTCDVLIIDEASMLDMLLFYNLLKAVTPGTRLVLVGDVDQLPSVGPGNVLRQLIDSERLPCVRLKTVFRQAQESMIVQNAHRINKGIFPLPNRKCKDFFLIEKEDPEEVTQTIVSLCQKRLPNYGSFDRFDDIQVLSPMRRTVTGVDNLNLKLQEALNPKKEGMPEVAAGATTFRLGDKVMQVRNNYRKEVFNGDLGRIHYINLEDAELTVRYPADLPGARDVVYDFQELDDLVLSYAISVHKSQGAEYPVIVMPIVTQHFLLLQRNLIYTAVTRARRLVVLVGTEKALAIAVKNDRTEERFSYLCHRLRRG